MERSSASPTPLRIIAFGEAMLELQGGFERARLAWGGDTLNAAVYLARLGRRPAYASALGDDPYSAGMRAAWEAEGLDLRLVLTAPGRLPGLYGVQIDEAGERSFHFWRRDSAVRAFFALPGADAALSEMEGADLLYLSGITLAIFTPSERERITALAAAVRRRGGAVAFDPNYRARLWTGPEEARAAFAAMAREVDYALPGLEDETALDPSVTPETVAARWLSAGAREVAVKLGPEGALCAWGEQRRRVAARRVEAVDTTGAGDSFNAAYLHARLGGAEPPVAAAAGARLAAEVVRHPGAVIPREAMPKPEPEPEPEPARDEAKA